MPYSQSDERNAALVFKINIAIATFGGFVWCSKWMINCK